MHPPLQNPKYASDVNVPSQTKWRNVGWKNQRFFIERLQTFYSGSYYKLLMPLPAFIVIWDEVTNNLANKSTTSLYNFSIIFYIVLIN